MANRGEPSHLDLTVADLATAIPFCEAVLGYLGYRPGRHGPDPVWLKRLASGPVWPLTILALAGWTARLAAIAPAVGRIGSIACVSGGRRRIPNCKPSAESGQIGR